MHRLSELAQLLGLLLQLRGAVAKQFHAVGGRLRDQGDRGLAVESARDGGLETLRVGRRQRAAIDALRDLEPLVLRDRLPELRQAQMRAEPFEPAPIEDLLVVEEADDA